MRVQIAGVGWAAPDTVETNAQVADRIGRSEAWIESRTGVLSRRVASTISMEDLGAKAASQALRDGPPPDLIINASTTPKQLIPDSSVFIQRSLGFSGIPSFSVHSTCLSFLTAFHVASSLAVGGQYRRILVVSSETGSISRNFEEAESAALIGDGAGAAVITATPDGQDSEMLAYTMGTWPEGADYTTFRGAGTHRHPNNPETRPEDNLFSMRGPRIYRMARGKSRELLTPMHQRAGVTPEDIDVFVPHQASGPMLSIIPDYGYAPERIVRIVEDYGNCIAASLPMALAVAVQDGRITRGKTVMFFGTGAGLSIGAAILRW